MDMSETLAPKSDQQNYDDYVTGPKILTVTAGILTGNKEQPMRIEVAEYPDRPYKPSLSMRRAIAAAWGTEMDAWVGRRIKLAGNPTIRYGGKAVGGIEVEAVSHIDKPVTLLLTETRGKKRTYTVQPLPDAAPKQATNEIPADVIANTQKAITNGTTADYLAWLREQNAPEFIVDYVKERTA